MSSSEEKQETQDERVRAAFHRVFSGIGSPDDAHLVVTVMMRDVVRDAWETGKEPSDRQMLILEGGRIATKKWLMLAGKLGK